jgi:hypothetical protein
MRRGGASYFSQRDFAITVFLASTAGDVLMYDIFFYAFVTLHM